MHGIGSHKAPMIIVFMRMQSILMLDVMSKCLHCVLCRENEDEREGERESKIVYHIYPSGNQKT